MIHLYQKNSEIIFKKSSNFEIDKKGKDSYEHLKSGSKEVVIYNEYKFAMITTKKKKKN